MYVYVAVLICGLLSGFAGGWKANGWRHDSAALAAQEQARETEKFRRQAANVASGKFEAAREKVRTEFVTLTERVNVEVEKPVYRNVCVAPDGLQQLAEAARATGYSGEPVSPMPTPAASAAR